MARQKKSVGLSDVQFSQNGEVANTLFNPEPQYTPQIGSNEELAQSEMENIIFRLVDRNKQGGVTIGCEDYVMNPYVWDKDGNKSIGSTPFMDSIHLLMGEDEIWGSRLKLKYGAEFSKFVKENTRKIAPRFINRTITVPKWDTPMIEFLRHHRDHIDNKYNKQRGRNNFFEYNPHREAEEANKKILLELECMQKLVELSEEKTTKLCVYLNIPLFGSLTGVKKQKTILQSNLMLFGKNDPEKFMKLLIDESIDVNYLIVKAITSSLIDTAQVHSTGKIYWSTGAFICSCVDESPKNALLNLALSKTSAGNEFLEQLKKVVM